MLRTVYQRGSLVVSRGSNTDWWGHEETVARAPRRRLSSGPRYSKLYGANVASYV
jgi:hypothetical protein